MKYFLTILFFICLIKAEAQFSVKGFVKDINNEPIIGANIVEKNTVNGTISDFDGSYQLEVSSAEAIIEFAYLGYVTQEIPVNNQSEINVNLSEDDVTLEQVVVVGYGVQKKRDVTGSISSLKAKDVEKIATPNIEQALQGKIAGVFVSPNSGAPGAGAVIRIRGTGTLNNANPLYVIDGMITYDASLINPQDVETIEVLKDASAAAIYGSRGANGVIIITTKNGKNRKTAQVQVSSYLGTQELIKEIPLLNGTQFARAYNQFRGSNFYPNPEIFGEGTNWQQQIFREAPMYNLQLSANGGNEQFSYNFSTNYFNQDGILNYTSFKRATFRLNSEAKLNSWLKLGNNVSYSLAKSQNGPHVIGGAYRMPSLLTVRDTTGEFTDPTFFGSALANPVADQYYKNNNYSTGNRLFGNLYFDATILKGLVFRSNFGFDKNTAKSKYFEPKFEVSLSQRNANDRLSVGYGEGNNWIWEQTITYTKEFGDHSITALAGYTAEERSGESFGASREGFPGTLDELLYLSAGNDTTQLNYGGAADEAMVSQLFRLNYGFKNKYFLTTSMRVDQSSRFTKDNRTGYFPSVSVGWNLGQESFIVNSAIFDQLKLRASYGVLGNQASANTYPGSGVVVGGLYSLFAANEILNYGATLTTIANSDLHWETSRQTDLGIDAGFLNGRLTMELDWYNRYTYDIIASVPIPDYIGSEGDPIVNTAEVKNTGFDIALNYRQVGAIGYNFGVNISPVKNEVMKLAKGKSEIFAAFFDGAPASRTVVGLPIGSYYGYQVEGIFQTAEEIAASPTIGGEKPGDIKFRDLNQDGIINDDDRTNLGSPIPTLTYGFNIGAEWKGIDIAIDFLGVYGNKVYNGKEVSRFAIYNWEEHVADAWTVDNPSNTEPRVTNGGHNYRVSDRFIQDGSYIRLRNINIGYTIPNSILSKIKLQSFRIFASGSNLWTKQKFTGYSPEFPNSTNPYEVGFDFGSYPIAKTMQVGIDIRF